MKAIFLFASLFIVSACFSQSGRVGWQDATNTPFYRNPVKFREIHFDKWISLPATNKDSASSFLFNLNDTSLYLHWKGANKPLVNNAGNLVIDESNLVHKTGNESIPGNKTFTGNIIGNDVFVNRVGFFDGANGYYNWFYYADQNFVYEKGDGYKINLVFPNGAYTEKYYEFPFAGKNDFKLVSSINNLEPGDDGNVNIPQPDLSNVVPYTGATQDVDLGNNILRAAQIQGYGNNGGITDDGGVYGNEFFLKATGDGSIGGHLLSPTLGLYYYTFPNKDGTVALESYVDDAIANAGGNQKFGDGDDSLTSDRTVDANGNNFTYNISNGKQFLFHWENPAGAVYDASFGQSNGSFTSNSINAAGTQSTSVYQDATGVNLQAINGSNQANLRVYADRVSVEAPLSLTGKISRYNGVPVTLNQFLMGGSSGGFNAVTPASAAAAMPVLNNQHPVTTGGTPAVSNSAIPGAISNLSVEGTDAAMRVSFTLNPGEYVGGGSLLSITYAQPWAARPKVVMSWNIRPDNSSTIEGDASDATNISVTGNILTPGNYTFTIFSMQ